MQVINRRLGEHLASLSQTGIEQKPDRKDANAGRSGGAVNPAGREFPFTQL